MWFPGVLYYYLVLPVSAWMQFLIGYVSCDLHGARVPCSGVIGVEPRASDH